MLILHKLFLRTVQTLLQKIYFLIWLLVIILILHWKALLKLQHKSVKPSYIDCCYLPNIKMFKIHMTKKPITLDLI
jgi:hypothetical protein